jgi:hypothetical protein
MAFLDDIIKRVRDYDASRPRSLQAEPGWSEVGGCRAYLGFRLEQAWHSDETDTWAAQRGTAIHKYLELVLAGVPGFRTEVTTSYRGIPGHADLVHIDDTSVTDWKTTRLVNSRLWASDPKVLWEKRVQAQGYACGLVDAGEVSDDILVRLAVIPVDGSFSDWWAWEERFDRSIADWGADRLDEVRARQAAGEHLPKDKPYAWCRDWCQFFSVCRGGDEADAAEIISDPEIAAAIARYGEINAGLGVLVKEKESLATVIRGIRGTTADGGWRIGMSKQGDPKEVIDEDAVRADYEARGFEVPMTDRPGRAPVLSVTRIKKKAAA